MKITDLLDREVDAATLAFAKEQYEKYGKALLRKGPLMREIRENEAVIARRKKRVHNLPRSQVTGYKDETTRKEELQEKLKGDLVEILDCIPLVWDD